MRNRHSFVTRVALATVLSATMVEAQQGAPPQDFLEQERARQAKQQEEEREQRRQFLTVIPLDVTVVVSRYQGDKRVSSLPYSLVVNAIHPDRGTSQMASIRMGAQIPLPSMAPPTVDGKPVTGMLTTNPVQYKEIGTFIDAQARWLEGGAFDLQVSVSDTSLYKRPQGVQPPTGEPIDDVGLPVLRTFTAGNQVVMKDGQTKQFMLAADRISGDTLRVDVTLKVAK